MAVVMSTCCTSGPESNSQHTCQLAHCCDSSSKDLDRPLLLASMAVCTPAAHTRSQTHTQKSKEIFKHVAQKNDLNTILPTEFSLKMFENWRYDSAVCSLAVFPKVPGLIPRIHMAAYNCITSSPRGSHTLFCLLQTPGTHVCTVSCCTWLVVLWVLGSELCGP